MRSMSLSGCRPSMRPFSLLASWINDRVSAFWQLRARTLQAGLQQMLGDDELHQSLFGQPSIQAAKSADGRDPSYVSASQFSLAVIGVLNVGSAIGKTGQEAFNDIAQAISSLKQSRLKGVLTAILTQSDAKVDSFVSGVESWFDDEMDRVTGWYKRNATKALLFIGLALAIAFNVDTLRFVSDFVAKPISLGNCTQNSQPATEQCVSRDVFSQVNLGWLSPGFCAPTPTPSPVPSSEPSANPSPKGAAPASIGATKGSARTAGSNASQPAGGAANANANASATAASSCTAWSNVPHTADLKADTAAWIWWLFKKLVGIFLTGIALSLGAPFWFDTLSRFVNVRSAGPAPQKSDQPSST